MNQRTSKVLDGTRTTLEREGRGLAAADVSAPSRKVLTIIPNDSNGGLLPLMAIEMGEEITSDAVHRRPNTIKYRIGFLFAPRVKQLQAGQPEMLTCRYCLGLGSHPKWWGPSALTRQLTSYAIQGDRT